MISLKSKIDFDNKRWIEYDVTHDIESAHQLRHFYKSEKRWSLKKLCLAKNKALSLLSAETKLGFICKRIQQVAGCKRLFLLKSIWANALKFMATQISLT